MKNILTTFEEILFDGISSITENAETVNVECVELKIIECNTLYIWVLKDELTTLISLKKLNNREAGINFIKIAKMKKRQFARKLPQAPKQVQAILKRYMELKR